MWAIKWYNIAQMSRLGDIYGSKGEIMLSISLHIDRWAVDLCIFGVQVILMFDDCPQVEGLLNINKGICHNESWFEIQLWRLHLGLTTIWIKKNDNKKNK